MKKKALILIPIALLAFVVAFGLSRPTGDPITIGNISRKDVAQIKSSIRTAFTHMIVPHSLKDVAELPSDLRDYFRYKIVKIEGLDNGQAEVTLQIGTNIGSLRIFRGTNYWRLP